MHLYARLHVPQNGLAGLRGHREHCVGSLINSLQLSTDRLQDISHHVMIECGYMIHGQPRLTRLLTSPRVCKSFADELYTVS